MAQDEMTITRAIHEVNNFTPEEVEAALAQRGAPTESEEEAAVQDFIETFGEFKSIFSSQPRNTVVNPGKDRSLSGKDRKRARREQRRGGLSDK